MTTTLAPDHVAAIAAATAGTAPFTEEEDALRGSIRRVAEDLRADAESWESDGFLPAAAFGRFGEVGALGLSLPAEVGGSGADPWTEVVLAEELARTGADGAAYAISVHAQFALPLLTLAADRVPQAVLDAVVGSHVLGLAAGQTPDATGLTASADGDGYRVAGTVGFVTNGVIADGFVVLATSPDGPVLLYVPREAGTEIAPLDLGGLRAAGMADVTFADAPAVTLAGAQSTVGDWTDARLAWHAVHAAALVGSGALVLEETRAYADQREVFGKPISTLQVQQHRLVDIATRIESVRRTVYDTVDRLALGDVTRTSLLATDLLARTMLFEIADECLQLHGGYGYSREYRVQQVWRDARSLLLDGGGVDDVRDRLAVELLRAGGLPDLARRPEGTRLPLFDAATLAFRDDVRRWFASKREQVDAWELAGEWPREFFTELGDDGLLGIMVHPEDGGTGPDPLRRMSMIEAGVVVGSGGLLADLGAHTDLAMVYVTAAGTSEQRTRYVREGATGRSVGSLGITEPATGSNVAGVTTRAVRSDGGWLINGTKHFITDGAWCDWMVVVARTDPDAEKPHRGISLFIVPMDTPGVTRRRMSMLGWRASHTGEVTFEDVHVPADALLGEENSGFYQIMLNFAWERLSLSVGACGANAQAIARVVREASARGLADSQARRHRLADLAARSLAGRAITDHALRSYVGQADPQVQNRATAMAKLVTQMLAVEVADELMTSEGRRAMLRSGESSERALRDARLGPIGGGTDEIMREIIKKTYGMR